MSRGLSKMLEALDTAPSPVQFFVRDDDAGWDDARLFGLLDCTERHAVPIDLAVIPLAVHDAFADALCVRVDAAPGLIGLHQHGFSHSNHEPAGRKCEFGAARSVDLQRRDLTEGRARLAHFFGERVDPIFTPPWNRCTSDTPTLLAELGYAMLSRDASVQPQSVIAEVGIHVDWCKLRRQDIETGVAAGGAIADAIAQRVAVGRSVGIMLHHAAMDETDIALLHEWLPALVWHPRARWTRMRDQRSLQ